MQPDTMPRFPREVEAHPLAGALAHRLAAAAAPLHEGAGASVADVALAPALLAALVETVAEGHTVRGLTSAERRLRDEKRGMTLADKRSETPRRGRMSRLLVIANDGALRFHRNVGNLLTHHGERLAVLRVEADEKRLGEALFGTGQVARAVLVISRPAVARVLLALVNQPDGEDGIEDGA